MESRTEKETKKGEKGEAGGEMERWRQKVTESARDKAGQTDGERKQN